jgi:molybdopterin molybdotransferase
MKPGAPLAFGLLQGRPFFGLPGNPVSSMVTFELFVRPALMKMMGADSLFRPQVEAIVEKDIPKEMGKTYFIRVMVERVGDHYVAKPTGEQGSGILMSMVKANGLLILSEKQQNVVAGERCRVILFDPSIPDADQGHVNPS